MLLILNLWNDVLFLRGDHWSPFFSSPNFVRDSALDVPFFPAGDQWAPLHSFFVGAVIGRPFLVSKTSYETAPSTFFFSCWRPMVAATFIFRRGGHWPPFFSFQNFVRDGALDVPFIAIFPFPTFQHVKASRYGLPYLLICCTCVGCVIRCFLSATATETRI